MKHEETKEFYDWSGFRLDAKNRLLWRDGKIISLTPKEYELLLTLVEEAGRVLTKDDLLARVWKDTFVEESTLTRNISWLRKKLAAASGDEENQIENLPRRGYRFLPAVTAVEAAPVLVIEEQKLTHIRVEETATISDFGLPISDLTESAKTHKIGGEQRLALPAAENPQSAIRNPQLLWFALGALFVAVVALAAYQFFFRSSRADNLLLANIAPFSGAPGRENTPAFSPDSRQLVFSWNGGERESADIYVQLIGAGEPVRLTDTPDVHEHYPVFSPDGLHIAFVRDLKTHGEIILIPALGGAERRVARLFSGNYSISFAPDGEEIAVVDTEDSLKGKPHRIYFLNLKTGERRRATDEVRDIIGETTPRVSPDGKRLSFVRVFEGHTHDLFVVETSEGGAAARQLSFDSKTIHSQTWSANGQTIFFVSTRESNRPNIWQIAAAGGAAKLLATSGKEITNLAVAPDGGRIAFVENSANSDIYQLAVGENAAARRFIASTFNEEMPDFSPDGNRVVFGSNRSGKNEAWLADAAGKNLRQLTRELNFSVMSPVFSPDGKRIVYEGLSNETSDVFASEIEGVITAPVRLTADAARDFNASWSADGRFVYFASDRGGARNIWRVSSGGGEPVQITRGGGARPLAAPDGKWIYYSKSPQTNGLWRVAVEGGDEQFVPELAAAGLHDAWAMAGNGIIYLENRDAPPFKFKFFDFADRRTREIPVDKFPLADFAGMTVSPDGKTILAARRNQAAGILFADLPQ